MFPRVWTVREVALRDVTLVVERFEVPVTFKEVPKIEETPRDVTLVVERLEDPVMYKLNSPPL